MKREEEEEEGEERERKREAVLRKYSAPWKDSDSSLNDKD